MYNLPANTTSLATGAGDPARKFLPAGTLQGNTNFGTAAYGGACPPQGDAPHPYHFTLYALKVANIVFPPEATAAQISAKLRTHATAQVTLTARFGR